MPDLGPLRASSIMRTSRPFRPPISLLQPPRIAYFSRSLSKRLTHTSRPPARPRSWPTNLLILSLISALPLYLLASHAAHDPADFHPYTLICKDPLSPTLSIFVLRPSSPMPSKPAPRGIHSVEVKNPLLQISRHYTPLPLPSTDETGGTSTADIHLLIRRAPSGEVSPFLHRLPLLSTVELRGPRAEYAIQGEDVRQVLFIAGGTGIAPALQVAEQLVGVDVGVLWAVRTRDEARGGVGTRSAGERRAWRGGGKVEMEITAGEGKNALVRLIDGIKKREGGERLKVECFVDEEGSSVSKRDVVRCLRAGGTGQGRKAVFVSGPDGFVDYIVGPRPPGGEEARRVERPGGVLGQVDTRGWEVVRL